jgi:hypothetical protein
MDKKWLQHTTMTDDLEPVPTPVSNCLQVGLQVLAAHEDKDEAYQHQDPQNVRNGPSHDELPSTCPHVCEQLLAGWIVGGRS